MNQQQDIQLTLAQRGSQYGDFAGHTFITQAIKEALKMGCNYTLCSNSQKEALDMIAHKIGRIVNGNSDYADSWIDIAGYATLISNQLATPATSNILEAAVAAQQVAVAPVIPTVDVPVVKS